MPFCLVGNGALSMILERGKKDAVGRPFFAGLCEVLWAVALKYTEGFTRLYPSIVTVFGMMASFLLLSRALRTLPLGIAYSVWTGIGTVGTVLVGVLMLGETMSLAQMLCVGCIVVGIVGLRALT